MSSISEAGNNSGLATTLAAGIKTISESQSIPFTQYERVVLSEDGSVFWVNTGTSKTFIGSLHIITDRQQNEDETLAANNIIFTAEEDISELNSIAPNTLWIGDWNESGVNLKCAFSSAGNRYEQAELWHYTGFAVYPALQSQILDSEYDIPGGRIVSNSLPIWLSLSTDEIQVYPSFLVPDNIAPPYIAAHIAPDSTSAVQLVPLLSGNLGAMESDQLMSDQVRLTLYGFDNQKAIQFLNELIEYSLTDVFGFMSDPAIRDEKRTQAEITAIAMKKTISFQASYYQSGADATARKLILQAGITTTTH